MAVHGQSSRKEGRTISPKNIPLPWSERKVLGDRDWRGHDMKVTNDLRGQFRGVSIPFSIEGSLWCICNHSTKEIGRERLLEEEAIGGE